MTTLTVSILFHDYLCQQYDHCREVCTDQMTVAHYTKPELLLGKTNCIHCGQCTNIGMRGGMTERIEFPRIR